MIISKYFILLLGIYLCSFNKAQAGIIFEPYFSYRSTKSIDPNRKENKDKETIKNREEKGLKAGLSFYNLFKIQASVGQSFTVTTTTYKDATDEYDEIDYQEDLNTDPDSESKDIKIKETDSRATFSLLFDPSFWILIMRAKAGVLARQRIVKTFEEDTLIKESEPPVTYKPQAGLGLGVKFSPSIYAVLEYNFYFYKFPETEPFERAAELSIGFSI